MASPSSASTNAADFESNEWRPRPALAVMVKAVTLLGPFAVGVVASRVVAHLMPAPPHIVGRIVWLAVITGFAYLAFVGSRPRFQRLVPLSMLMNTTLVFPDQAPSRFKTALRGQSARDIERLLAEPAEDQGDGLPMANRHAVALVGLIGELSDHDRRTRGHSERVRAYSDVIAEQMGLVSEERQKLHWAALLHDVGKLYVDPEVLNSPGRPSEEGWQQIRGHPAHSEQLLAGLREWLGEWVGAASEHHERFDGNGYPKGLKGSEISLAGRIVAVADAYDVMTSARSYKKPLPAEAARQELIRNSGTQFDPAVVRAMLAAGVETKRRLPGFLAAAGEIPALASNVGATFGATTASIAVTAASVGFVPPPMPDPGFTDRIDAAVSGIPDGLAMVGGDELISEHVEIAVGSEEDAGSPGVVDDDDSAVSPETSTAPVTEAPTTTTTSVPPASGRLPQADPGPPSTTTTAAVPDGNPPLTTSTAPVVTTTTPEAATTTTTAPGNTTTTAPATTTTSPATTTTTSTPASWVTAVGDAAATSPGSSVDVSVAANDSFADSYQPNSIAVLSGPAFGSLSIIGGGSASVRLRFDPQGGAGTAVFSYQVCDRGGACGSASVSVVVS